MAMRHTLIMLKLEKLLKVKSLSSAQKNSRLAIVTKSLRSLLNDPSLIEKWIEIYKSKTSSELPEVQNRKKQLDQEIQSVTKKMKIKIGMYAPTKEQYRATGTDGVPSPESKTQNLNEIKEGKLIPFSPNRVGSSTVGNGARDWT